MLLDAGASDLLRDAQVFVGDPDRVARLQRLVGEGLMRASSPVPAGSGPISKRVIRAYVVGPDASAATVSFCDELVTACPPDVRGLASHAHRMAESLPELLDVVLLPRCGHTSPLELPDEVNALLGELAGTTPERVGSV